MYAWEMREFLVWASCGITIPLNVFILDSYPVLIWPVSEPNCSDRRNKCKSGVYLASQINLSVNHGALVRVVSRTEMDENNGTGTPLKHPPL